LFVRLDAQENVNGCGAPPIGSTFTNGNCDPTSSASGTTCSLGCSGALVQSPTGTLAVTCTNGAWSQPTATCSGGNVCGTGWTLNGQSMEGAFNAHAGYWLNFGFHYECDRPVTITWQASACWPFKCSSGGQYLQQSPYCLNNYIITLATQTGTYTVKDTATGLTYNWDNENLAWPPGWNIQLPCLCGGCTASNPGGNNIAANGGTNFILTPIAASNTACCVPQLHYRVPGAKSNTNANLSSFCSPQNSNSAVCGASWSATPQKECVVPGSSCSVSYQGEMATSPGAVAGYSIAGIVVVGVLALAIYWNFKSGAKSGGHQRTPSNMKDENIDLNDGRPAAPSGATPNVEVTIQTSS